jgi:hypothetical protein
MRRREYRHCKKGTDLRDEQQRPDNTLVETVDEKPHDNAPCRRHQRCQKHRESCGRPTQ